MCDDDDERSRRPTREDMPVLTNEQPKKEVYRCIATNPPMVRCVEPCVGDASERDRKDESFLNAVSRADTAAVSAALKAGQDVNIATQDGKTAVFLACMHDEIETLDTILARRPNAVHANKQGDVPMTAAIRGGHTEAVKALLASQLVDLSVVNAKTGQNLLHEAAWVDNLEAAAVLLATGAFEGRMDDVNGHGHNALHLAAFRACPEFCQLLVDFHADPAAKQQTKRWAPLGPADVADAAGKGESAKLLRQLAVATNSVKFAARMKRGGGKKASADAPAGVAA